MQGLCAQPWPGPNERRLRRVRMCCMRGARRGCGVGWGGGSKGGGGGGPDPPATTNEPLSFGRRQRRRRKILDLHRRGEEMVRRPKGPNKFPQITEEGGGGVWHKASVSDCLPLVVPIGLSLLLILTLCGPEHVLVVSTEPLDDLSCWTTPGVGCPRDGLLPVPLTRCTHMHTSSPCGVCRLQHWGGGGGPKVWRHLQSQGVCIL